MNVDWWPPADLLYVLDGIPSTALKAWLKDQNLPVPGSHAEAVVLAGSQSVDVMEPLYLANRVSGRRVAVTWFRGIKKWDELSARMVLDPLGSDWDSLDPGQFALVWSSEIPEGFAVRAAYRESSRLVRVGLGYRSVTQLGIATLVWRTFGVSQALEIYCQSARLRGLVTHLFYDLTKNENCEVLDIRPNQCADSIRSALNGLLTDAVAGIDDPECADDRVTFAAKAGRDLASPDSRFPEYSAYPGRGRTIEYQDAGRTVRFSISQRDYSAVFNEMNLDDSATVFSKAVQVGTWAPYP